MRHSGLLRQDAKGDRVGKRMSWGKFVEGDMNSFAWTQAVDNAGRMGVKPDADRQKKDAWENEGMLKKKKEVGKRSEHY